MRDRLKQLKIGAGKTAMKTEESTKKDKDWRKDGEKDSKERGRRTSKDAQRLYED